MTNFFKFQYGSQEDTVAKCRTAVWSRIACKPQATLDITLEIIAFLAMSQFFFFVFFLTRVKNARPSVQHQFTMTTVSHHFLCQLDESKPITAIANSHGDTQRSGSDSTIARASSNHERNIGLSEPSHPQAASPIHGHTVQWNLWAYVSGYLLSSPLAKNSALIPLQTKYIIVVGNTHICDLPNYEHQTVPTY